MFRYVVKRILLMIPVILGVLTLVFLMSAITPGDPVDQLVGIDAPESVREATRESLGLNDPLVVRYVKYIFNFVTKGDLGISYYTRQAVSTEIMSRFPYTMILAFVSLGVGVAVGIPLGVVSAVRQYSWMDSAILVLSMIAASMPNFWLALLCISLFAVKLKILPVHGIATPLGWVLPIIVCAVDTMAGITRITRSSMLEVIRADYIRTARAKGQTERVIIWKHALKNALIPVITSIGATLGSMLGGALTIESVFAIPGIGKYMVDAISHRDFPAIQGGVIVLAIVFTIINLVVDLIYTVVDPRLKSMFVTKKRSKLLPKSKEAAVNG